MTERKPTDALFYNRLYRINSDVPDGPSYIVHADQVEDLAKSYYRSASNNNQISIIDNPDNINEITGNVGDILIVIAK